MKYTALLNNNAFYLSSVRFHTAAQYRIPEDIVQSDKLACRYLW